MSGLPRSTGVEVARLFSAIRAGEEITAPITMTDAEYLLPRLCRSWFRHRVIDGVPYSVVADGAGGYQRLTGALLDEATRHTWPLPGPRPDAAGFERVAAVLAADLIAEADAAEVALPEAARVIAEHDRELARAARTAELEARTAADAAELAELAAGRVPAVEVEAVRRRGLFTRSTT